MDKLEKAVRDNIEKYQERAHALKKRIERGELSSDELNGAWDMLMRLQIRISTLLGVLDDAELPSEANRE